MAQMVRNYDRFAEPRKAEIASDAVRFLATLDGGI
jgi:hypothetical protein